MPRHLPATGRYPKPPQKDADYQDNHGAHFAAAIQDALNVWVASSEADEDETPETHDVYVYLEATITSNPGGIKEYRATITSTPL